MASATKSLEACTDSGKVGQRVKQPSQLTQNVRMADRSCAPSENSRIFELILANPSCHECLQHGAENLRVRLTYLLLLLEDLVLASGSKLLLDLPVEK